MSGSAFYTHYQAWGRMMALHGLCVFFVDFRNSLVPGLVDADGSTGEVAEYPGGLNDCVSGVRCVLVGWRTLLECLCSHLRSHCRSLGN